MSGPKISVYELIPEARHWIMGQLRCELQSISYAERIRALVRECLSYRSDYQAALARLELLQSRTGDQSANIEELKAKFSHAETALNQISSVLQRNAPHRSEKYELSEEAYAEKKRQLNDIKQLYLQTANVLGEIERVVNREKDREEAETQSINDSIAEDISSVYSFDIVPENEASNFEGRKKEVFDRLVALGNKPLPKGPKGDLQSAIQFLEKIGDSSHLSSFEAITVRKLEKAAEEYRLNQLQLQKEFDAIRSRYHALCQMANRTAEEFSIEDQARMQTEIENLELLICKQHEQSYIYDCVDEVMTEMGYDLIGKREVRKRNGKHFRNELYTFSEGTAVNITYSSDGQIAMELGGLAHQDRIPTAAETEALTSDMESFCDEFSVFEQKLRDRGVMIGNRIALSPPSAEYASIINVNDYSLEEGVQVSEMIVREKKKQTADQKYMWRND